MMSLKEIQPRVYRQLSGSFAQQRLAHAYLFEGEPSTGKESMARWLTQRVFCEAAQTDPCGECLNCRRIQEGNHPDVTKIEPEGKSIKVEQVREIKEVFIKSGLESQRKVLIIAEAEQMTVSAANSLLKFIEEPEGQVLIILLTTAKAKILPTIVSRCQTLHFDPLETKTVSAALTAADLPAAEAEYLAKLFGNTEKAIEISQDEWFNEAKETAFKWFELLTVRDSFSFVFVQQKLIKSFAEREKQSLLFEMLLLYFNEMLLQEVANRSVRPLVGAWQTTSLVEAVEACLSSQKKFNANVSFQNVCEQLSIYLVGG